jgi:uncharacterized protein YbjT (DUF2867 family)
MSVKVAVVGVNGYLGKPIIAGLTGAEFGSQFTVRAVSRSEPKQKYPNVEYVVAFDEESYTKAFTGMDAVVDLRAGGVLGDLSPVNAAIKAGIKMYLPSEFGLDYYASGEYMPVFAHKLRTVEVLKKAGIRVTQLQVGFFADTVFGDAQETVFLDLKNGIFEPIQGRDYKFSITSIRDIGLGVASVLSLPVGKVPERVKLQSFALSTKDFAELYEKTTGKKLVPKPISLETVAERGKVGLASGLHGQGFFDMLRAITATHPATIEFSATNDSALIANGKFKYDTASDVAARLWK